MQVCLFPKAKTGKHKGEIKTHQRRKNWKAKKSKQQKQKNKYAQKVHLKTLCNNPLGNWKKVGKSWMMGKQSYSWYLGSGLIQIYLSLYFLFKIFMRIFAFFLKISVQLEVKRKRIKRTSLTTVVLWFSWCAHLRAWLHLLKTKLVRNQTERKTYS